MAPAQSVLAPKWPPHFSGARITTEFNVIMVLNTSAGSVGCIKIKSVTLFSKNHLKSHECVEELMPSVIEAAMLLKCLPNLSAISFGSWIREPSISNLLGVTLDFFVEFKGIRVLMTSHILRPSPSQFVNSWAKNNFLARLLTLVSLLA